MPNDAPNAQRHGRLIVAMLILFCACGLFGGVVGTYNGGFAMCYYTASNGGQTELAGNVWTSNLPYLVQKDDPYDYENTASVKKSYTFRRDFSANSLPDSVEDAMRSAVAAEFTKNGLSTAASGVIIESLDGMELHSPNYPAPSRTYTQVRVTVTARPAWMPPARRRRASFRRT